VRPPSLVALALALGACGRVQAGAVDAAAQLDAGALDAAQLDAGALDAAQLDAGALDAGPCGVDADCPWECSDADYRCPAWIAYPPRCVDGRCTADRGVVAGCCAACGPLGCE